MRAYGVRRQDRGCCPGHDKFPPDRYTCTRTGTRRRAQQPRKSRARQEGRAIIRKALREARSQDAAVA